MPVVQCSHCGQRFEAIDDLIGQQVPCTCGHLMLVAGGPSPGLPGPPAYGSAPMSGPQFQMGPAGQTPGLGGIPMAGPSPMAGFGQPLPQGPMQTPDPFAAAGEIQITPIVDVDAASQASSGSFSDRQKLKAERTNRRLTIAGVSAGVLILCVLVVAVFLGGTTTLNLTGSWHEVAPSEYTVARFPAPPKEQNIEGDQPRRVVTSVVGDGLAVFRVEARGMTLRSDRESIKQALNTVRDSLNTSGRVEREQDVWLNHFPGRIFHCDVNLPTGETAVSEIRVFLDAQHNTVYFVQVLQSQPVIKPSDVQRFFDSFQFTTHSEQNADGTKKVPSNGND